MSYINTSGTFILFFANILSKLFGAFYRLPLSNLLGAEGMGLYQMAFPIYSFLLTMITGGIGVTLTRQIAYLRAKNENNLINKQYVLGKKVSLFFGIIFFLLIIFLSYPMAVLQGNFKAFYGYFAIAIGFVFACMLGAYRGYYQGYGNMLPTAISQIIEQGAKLIFGLVFAYIFLKQNVILGVFGALLGISFSEIVSFIYFFFLNKKKLPKVNVKVSKNDYKTFMKQVIPVSITYVLLPLSSLIDSFLIVNLLQLGGFTTNFATSLYGIETGMILPLINMPNVLVSAIALASLPEVSFKLSKKLNTSKQISTIFRIVLIFILPCSVGLFIMAEPIIRIVFPLLDSNLLSIAVTLLKFSSIEMFYLSFVTISNAILQALNKTKKAVLSLSIGISLKLVFTIILVLNANINILGLVLASTLCYFIVTLINVKTIKKQTCFRISFMELFSPILSSVLMAIMVIIFNYNLNLSNSIWGVFALILMAIITYFCILIALKQINFKDVKKLFKKQ